MNKKIILIIATCFLSPFGYANADTSNLATINGKPGTYLHVMASYAPLDYVSGGIVSIRDSRGKLIAKGETNTRGTFTVPLTLEKFKSLPLKVIVTGGKIISQSGDLYKGPKFKGRLRGEVNAIPNGPNTPVYLDVVSTVASLSVSPKLTYDKAIGLVRQTLRISSAAPIQILRYENNYVGNSELKSAIDGEKGYNRFVKRFAKKIRNGEKVDNISLSPAHDKGSFQAEANPADLTEVRSKYTNNKVLGQSEVGKFAPVCDVPLPNHDADDYQSSSTIIEDFGVIAAKDLMNFVGIPSTGIGDSVIGMLLTGGSQGADDATVEALKRANQQLNCISAQNAYLITAVDELLLTTKVSVATPCSSEVQDQYYTYQGLVEGAMPNADGSPSKYPLDSSNPNLMATLPAWSPSSPMHTACGGGKLINDMLFGSVPGQKGSWPQLNSNYQNVGGGGYYWYTQSQVQELQQFLSFWSTILYENFVLSNEYFNFYQLYQLAKIAAGNDEIDPLLCENGTTSKSSNYCAWVSNIKNAYPSDLYSDEIAIPDTGRAVSPYPAGLAIQVGQKGLNLSYIVNHLNARGEYYAKEAAEAALKQWNSMAVIGGTNSKEDFSAPKTIKENAYERDYSRLGYPNVRDGTSSASFLLRAINSSPISEWHDLNSSINDISFWTYDQWAHEVKNDHDQLLVALGSMANRGDVWADCSWRSWFDYCEPNQHPVMGVLLARQWWAGASTATTYTPPPPASAPPRTTGK